MKPRKYPTYTLYICIGLADVVNGVNAVLTLLVYKTSCKQVSYDSLQGQANSFTLKALISPSPNFTNST